MKNKIIYILLFSLLLIFGTQSYAQTVKDFYKAGKKAASDGNTEQAIVQFSYALRLSADEYDILIARAKQYDITKEFDKALGDYESALALKDKDEKVLMRAADLNMYFNKTAEAMKLLNIILSRNDGDIEALEKIVKCQVIEHKYADAIQGCNFAIETYKLKTEYYFHYYAAIASDSLKNYATAILEYNNTLKYRDIMDNHKSSPTFTKPIYISMAQAYQKSQAYEQAIKNYTSALLLDSKDTIAPKNNSVYYLRSFSYLFQSDYNNAIGDLTRAIVTDPKDKLPLYQRALVYMKSRQFLSAINDFTKFLQMDNSNSEAYSNRGNCYNEMANYKDAAADFQKAYKISFKPSDSLLLVQAKQILYDSNKETDKPEIEVTYPIIDMYNFINVLFNQYEIMISGKVKDKSEIESIRINTLDAKFSKDQLNPDFVFRMPINNDVNQLEIVVSDIYHNITTKIIKVGHIISSSKVMVKFSGKIINDDANKTPYKNRDVYLTNKNGEVLYVVKADENGSFSFTNLPYDQNYTLALDTSSISSSIKPKFIITDQNNLPILSAGTDGKEKFRFQILLTDYNAMSLMTMDGSPLLLDMRGKLYGGSDRTPLANITVFLLDEKGEIVATKKTDNFGAFLFTKLMPKVKYTIRTDKEDTKNLNYNKILITDENGKIITELTQGANGYFDYQLLPTDKMMLTRISDTDPWIKTELLSKTKKELVIIENIYYPSDSYEILPDAEVVIQKAIEAMLKNNNLAMEIQSHTDAIAGETYNLDLSVKRANTVVNYMIEKGVSKTRLIAKGFGESQLTNRCKDGVECSEEEHKQNRRTVFKIDYLGN